MENTNWKNETVLTMTWTLEDVASILEDAGIEPTELNVRKALAKFDETHPVTVAETLYDNMSEESYDTLSTILSDTIEKIR